MQPKNRNISPMQWIGQNQLLIATYFKSDKSTRDEDFLFLVVLKFFKCCVRLRNLWKSLIKMTNRRGSEFQWDIIACVYLTRVPFSCEENLFQHFMAVWYHDFSHAFQFIQHLSKLSWVFFLVSIYCYDLGQK